MNQNDVVVLIDELWANPYQPRKEEDQAAVLDIAQNILHNATVEFDGLLQVPTVRRRDGGGYELAFGHTRLAAFYYLRSTGNTRYEKMRVNVRDLTDLQMFELAVTENIKRRDLNPIEQAEAIQKYMEVFGKTSAEAAEFFGVAASTVRGLVRLLNLPEVAQEKVRSGEINTQAARALLVVHKLRGEEGVADVFERMTDDGDGPMESVRGALLYADETTRLDHEDEWMNADPFPRKYWKPVTKKDIADLLIVEDVSELNGKEEDLARLVSYVAGGMDVTDDAFSMFSPDGLERVRVVANPPGCMNCPLHAQLDGDHWCALKACAERKKEAWFSSSAERVSEETGIPVYDKARDGAFAKLNMYNGDNAKLYRNQHEDVRLMPAKSEVYGNHAVDLDMHVQAVVVGKTLEKLRKKDEKQKVKETEKKEAEMPWEVRSAIVNAGLQFVWIIQWEMASKSFASLFDGVNNFALLNCLRRDVNYPGGLDEDELVEAAEKMRKADGLAQMRRIVVMGVLNRETDYNSNDKNPIIEYGKTVAGFAKDLGVKLPKDWDAQMKKYQEECTAAVDEIVKAWKEKK